MYGTVEINSQFVIFAFSVAGSNFFLPLNFSCCLKNTDIYLN